MRIIVIDGQGGGIGKAFIEKLRGRLGNDVKIIALGTNALAVAAMLKAGANEGASGENAIVVNVPDADFILGSVAIMAADSMLGEVTKEMASAIAKSPAKKILIPLNKSGIRIAGIKEIPLLHYIDEAVSIISRDIERMNNNV